MGGRVNRGRRGPGAFRPDLLRGAAHQTPERRADACRTPHATRDRRRGRTGVTGVSSAARRRAARRARQGGDRAVAAAGHVAWVSHAPPPRREWGHRLVPSYRGAAPRIRRRTDGRARRTRKWETAPEETSGAVFGSRVRPAHPVRCTAWRGSRPLSCRLFLRTRRRSRRRRPSDRHRRSSSEHRWMPARDRRQAPRQPFRTACWPWRGLPSRAARGRC